MYIPHGIVGSASSTSSVQRLGEILFMIHDDGGRCERNQVRPSVVGSSALKWVLFSGFLAESPLF